MEFFICFNASAPTTNCPSPPEEAAGHFEIAAAGGKDVTLSTIAFDPPDVEGFYCFRVVYTPAELSPFLPATETNTSTTGSNPECFQVVKPPTRLSVRKVCLPHNDGHFNLQVENTLMPGMPIFTLPNAVCGANSGPRDVEPGTYKVSETEGAGLNLEQEFGGDCNAEGLVTLALGDTKNCQVVNLAPGTSTAELRVIKECDPETADYFDAVIDSGTAESQRYTLPCGGDTEFFIVATGTHTVTEEPGTDSNTNLSTYTTTFSGDCTATGPVTATTADLAKGAMATCTIINRLKPSTLEIIKQCVPKNATDRFDITIEPTGQTETVTCGGKIGPIDVTLGATQLSSEAAPTSRRIGR